MKTKDLFRFLFFILHLSFIVGLSLSSRSQVPTVQDCLGAIPVCQDIYTQATTYLGSGNYPNEIYNNPGNCVNDCPGSCLDGEQNSVWYVFTVQTSGMLRMTITPFYNADDYDWAVYDITVLRCSDIYSMYPQMQKSCNAWGSSTFNGPTGISSAMGGTAHCNHCGDGSGTSKWNADLAVTAGRTYVLIIENWGTTPQGGYTLDFSASTASIYDNVRPYLQSVHSDEISCGTTQIVVEFSENVMCESVDASDFLLTGPGGPYTVLSVSGETCMLGGTMERIYTLTIDRPIGSDGDYAMQLVPMNFVYDACNNFALGNTVTFTVSLGAPVINTLGMTIQPATCGIANGSITGILVGGNNPPFTYLWTNQSGAPVGSQLNLTNVPSGNYTLKVTDNSTCATFSGPHFVSESGGPEVDESGLVITGANYGANNGHITGLAINGNGPFNYEWTDENAAMVGTDIDLHDVYSGNYFLTVIDVNNCDTLLGPYFVQQIGGPLGVQASASPLSVCLGESSQLNANAFGGTGIYTFSWASNPPGFSSGLQSPVVFPAITTTYTVTIDDGYNSENSSVIVQVSSLPVSSAGDDQTIPYGTSTTIYGSATGGSGTYHYQWEPADMLISPNAQNPATKKLYQTTLFRVRVTDLTSGCEGNYDTVVVYLDGGPLGVTLSISDDTICKGESTIMSAFGFGGNYGYYTYTWYYGTEVLKVEENITSALQVNPIVQGTYVYTVEIDDGYNTSSSQITLVVAPSPVFFITGTDPVIACPFDTVTLAPSMTYQGSSYYWSNGSVEPEIRISSTGIGYDVRSYELTVTNSDGCVFSDSITVIFDFAACFGIEENRNYPTVKVYPNPSPGLFQVELEEMKGFSRLQVINANGFVVHESELDGKLQGYKKIPLDLSAFPGGFYFLRVIHERFMHHQKLVVN